MYIPFLFYDPPLIYISYKPISMTYIQLYLLCVRVKWDCTMSMWHRSRYYYTGEIPDHSEQTGDHFLIKKDMPDVNDDAFSVCVAICNLGHTT